MAKKKANSYGSFTVRRRRNLVAVIGTSTVVLLAVIVGLVLFNAGKKDQVTSGIPKAQAEELPGWWLKDNFGSAICDKENCKPEADPDKDKLANAQEFYYHSHPLKADTNENGLTDGEDVAYNFDPSKPGKMTFEQASTPENLLGESLVFADDLKKMVAEQNDISKVALPLPADEELNIVYEETDEIYKTYAREFQGTVDKYFPRYELQNIQQVLKDGNDNEVIEIKYKTEALSRELRNIAIPVRFLTFHKYNISLFDLMSQILPARPDSDEWFEKMQEFLAVQQKLYFEEQRLKKLDEK